VISLKNDLVGDFRHTYLSTSLEIRKHLRRRRILITATLALLLPVIFYIVPIALDRDFAETGNAFASTNLGFVNLLIIISAAIFTGDTISGEFENRTGLLLFPTPQRRNTIFVGKFVAALLTTWIAVSLYYLVTCLEIISIYGAAELSIELAHSFLLALIYGASVVGLIFFFSSILKRTITSTLLGFFLLMMILPITSAVLSLAEVDPWFLVTHSAGLITDVFNLPSAGGFRPGQGPGAGPVVSGALVTFSPEFYLGITVMAIYAITPFLAGLMIANRKQMAG
jgi:ABC-2 type transport system permease protein